ncbi:gephyrin-like molybdotransferase Glp [Palleronia caenipelagi]|uniref:Molybdopterin molybdenumtransferase n=1 Tax=Palleronia caenipelagi TaxID=2489174 RepID=A0A547Q9A9_9RHOB|nr:gephyrin-like molybdotransferase Glp [Palleronia caenipelagi]TRD22975.1 molybdopterin molybdotransferase MoeA [Palleronia caenipelagi]
MISVEEALSHLFALVRPLGAEAVPLRQAAGRVLACACTATRAQPPFDASAMDGYAIADADPLSGAQYRVVGESAAGHAYRDNLRPGEAVRILTGAPAPNGAKRIIIQEDVLRQGDRITIGDDPDPGPYIRRKGADFDAGFSFGPERRLTPADIALLAAMGQSTVTVIRQPSVAIISTGDELVDPADSPAADQIYACNHLGLAAMIEAAGGRARILPIAGDTEASLSAAFDMAAGADLIVTIGGASVGDHDVVATSAARLGLNRSFYKVAMRPGKPLMAGRIAGTTMIGLPGNPVSSMVCGTVFLIPVLRKMMGLGEAPAPRKTSPLAASLGANGPREHYMRATLGPKGLLPAESQDSARIGLLAQADALMIRPPHDPDRQSGEVVEYISLSGD